MNFLGIPLEKQWDLKRWSDGVAGFTASARITTEQATHAENVAREAEEYLMGLFVELRKNPNDGLLSKILNAPKDDSGDALTDKEIVGPTIQLFFAGFETTEGLIGNMVLAMMNNPNRKRCSAQILILFRLQSKKHFATTPPFRSRVGWHLSILRY